MNAFRLFATAAAIAVISVPVSAQGKSGNKAAKAPTQVQRGGSQGHGGGKAGSTAGGAKSVRATDTGAKAGPSKTTRSGSPTNTASGSGTAPTSGTTPSTAPAPAPTVPTSPLAVKISKNPNQLARVNAMLPAGMTLDEATAGFRNQGQFIAALNASKNRGVSFVDLQKAMTVDGMSLGQAAKQLKNAPPTTPTTPTTPTAPAAAGTSATGTSAGAGASAGSAPAAGTSGTN
jgi:hypothetical protein